MTGSMTPPSGVDYSVLADPNISYFGIARARAYGLTDSQIGRAYAIADNANVPFQEVLNMLERGDTFFMIAQYYGVDLKHVTDASDYTNKVTNYITAYETTGRGAMGKMDMSLASSNSMNGGSMSGGSMSPSDTSTPPQSGGKHHHHHHNSSSDNSGSTSTGTDNGTSGTSTSGSSATPSSTGTGTSAGLSPSDPGYNTPSAGTVAPNPRP
jgi:hypothetical protein